MRPVPAAIPLLCACAAAARELAVRVEHPRSYGGELLAARARAPEGVRGLVWETSVAGAPLERGRVPVGEDGRATLSVRTPEVSRAVEMTVRVQSAAGETRVSCGVRVFPAYDGSRLRRLFASARVGVAELRDEISSHLARLDCPHEKAGGRLALGLFEGDVLVASGGWWAGEGRFAAGLLRGHLARGARIVVLECSGGGLDLFPARKDQLARRLVIADRGHLVSSAPGVDSGWGEVPTLLPDPAGNLRRLVVDRDGGRPVIVESLPPGGGALLRVSLPVLSRFEGDPAAPILFERCLAWALQAEPPEWKRVALRLGDEEGLAERLGELGVAGMAKLPRDGEGVLLASPARFTRDVREWAESGGTALVLVPGAPDSARVTESDDAALRGITRGLVRRLCAEAGEGEAWGEIDLGVERRVLAAGLLDRVDLGEGKAYVLRVGPLDEEMTGAWREFLRQVLTNLGVGCGEVTADE